MPWTCHQVAGMIDHTCLKAYATREDFQKLCREAMEYGFKSVAVNTYPVRMCREMLEKAGFSLTHSSKADLIVEFFIRQGNYNIYAINEALFSFDQKLLGSVIYNT